MDETTLIWKLLEERNKQEVGSEIYSLLTEAADHVINCHAKIKELGNKLYELENPSYCHECGACGEDGCCPPTMCKCLYKEGYRQDWKELSEICDELIKENTELKDKIKHLEVSVSETKLLESLFGTNKYWNGYELDWCQECDRARIKLECCGNISCSGGGCSVCCGEDGPSTQFSNNVKKSIGYYLNDEEKKTKRKINFLKKYILDSLAAGFNEINWEYLHKNGHLCLAAYKLFEELEDYDPA